MGWRARKVGEELRAHVRGKGSGDMARAAEILCKQGCGKTFIYESWRVRHELKCQGKVATRGRIERLAARRGAPIPAIARHQAAGKRDELALRGNGHAERTPPAIGTGAIVAAATSKAIEIVIAGLRAKREQIDVAIASLEALEA
jgi:hypothetical protein